jgi:hypothetical protein
MRAPLPASAQVVAPPLPALPPRRAPVPHHDRDQARRRVCVVGLHLALEAHRREDGRWIAQLATWRPVAARSHPKAEAAAPPAPPAGR